MANVGARLRQPPRVLVKVPFYYGWVMVVVAAVAMVGTFPGRTQGLGLITESLLKDLSLDRVSLAQMNLWATLLGSLFCLGFGRLLDQLGSRIVLTIVSLSLGGVVLAMSSTYQALPFFLLLTLSRGLGQSALSVVSLTLVGQWFRHRLRLAMGVYSMLLSLGFMAAFPLVGSAILSHGWRIAWARVGWCLILGLMPAALLLVHGVPEDSGLQLDGTPPPDTNGDGPDFTWINAMRTPAFWVFALGSSTFNLIASGIGLFNESILAERGFDASVYYRSLAVTAVTSLAGNFLGGWLVSKWSINRLMTLAMALLSGALIGLPSLRTIGQVDVFAVVMGISGGFIMVIFFGFWAKAFGRAHLGRIQGTAQMMTVMASAIGPLLLAKCQAWTGSYASIFYLLAGLVSALGVAAWQVGQPRNPIVSTSISG